MLKKNYGCLQIYTSLYTQKRGKGSPPDTPLRQLRGIGPLFTQRLQDQGFETLQDIYNYLSRPDTTRGRYYSKVSGNLP